MNTDHEVLHSLPLTRSHWARSVWHCASNRQHSLYLWGTVDAGLPVNIRFARWLLGRRSMSVSTLSACCQSRTSLLLCRCLHILNGLAGADCRQPALGHCRAGPGGRIHSLWDAALCVDRAQAAWFWCASTSASDSSSATHGHHLSKHPSVASGEPAASMATAHCGWGSQRAGLDEPNTAGRHVNLAISTAPEPGRSANSACISSASADSCRTSPHLRFA